MKAEDFDHKFDDGENIIEYLDLTQIKRSNCEEKSASSNSLQTSLFAVVAGDGSIRRHKPTKSLSGKKRFKLVRSRAKTIDKNC